MSSNEAVSPVLLERGKSLQSQEWRGPGPKVECRVQQDAQVPPRVPLRSLTQTPAPTLPEPLLAALRAPTPSARSASPTLPSCVMRDRTAEALLQTALRPVVFHLCPPVLARIAVAIA